MKFQARITEEEQWWMSGLWLHTTHNGYQWSSVNLSLDEIKILRGVLDEKIKELEEVKNDN